MQGCGSWRRLDSNWWTVLIVALVLLIILIISTIALLAYIART